MEQSLFRRSGFRSSSPEVTFMNLRLNEKLLKEAMKITGHRSKRTVIEAALRALIQIKKQAGIRQLKGKIHFDADHPKRLARLGGQEPSPKGIRRRRLAT